MGVGLVLALPILAIVVVTLHDLALRPTFRRLALRNISRRPGEAALVVLGSLLGTAIITSSFIVGDTLDASIRDLARTQLGPVDVRLGVADPAALAGLREAVDAEPVAGVDGVLSVLSSIATVATPPGDDRRAEPTAGLFELDVDQARAFGGDPSATGFDGDVETPVAGEALINLDLADELDVAAGDTVHVFAYGQETTFEVAGVLPRVGLAGLGPPRSRTPNVFLPPGTLAELAAAAPDDSMARPPRGSVFVSAEGGVFDGVERADEVITQLEPRLEAIEAVDIDPAKQVLLDQAENQGRSFTELFTSIGGFSVIAGVLLLVNIFVMLAEERKSELGVLRAVGLKRNHLVRTFGMEGSIYAAVAALAGAVVGIGVGRVIVLVTAGIFGDSDVGVSLRFAVAPDSLLLGFAVGLAIGLLTVWGTSIRIGRLNVIRAIRDLPEPTVTKRRVRTLVLAAAGVLAGVALLVVGIDAEAELPALAGPAVSLFCLVPLLVRVLPRRLAVSLPCIGVLAWGIGAFVVLPGVFGGSDIPIFVLQGIILVGSAVALVATNADVSSVLSEALAGSRSGLAARLGLAYPLAKRFRTALLLGMYAIVVFTLTFLASFSHIFAQQAPSLTEETRAGFDVLVDSNPANPVTVSQLEAQPDVVGVAGLLRAGPVFTASFQPDETQWPLTGFGADFLERGAPALTSLPSGFASEADVWRSVLDSPDRAIISEFFLAEEGGPPSATLAVGETFTVANRATGDERTMTVAGVVTSDFVFNGVFATDAFVSDLMGPLAAPVRHYVDVDDAADAEAVADRLTGELLANGVDATTFAAAVDLQIGQQAGFLRLFEGFLSLGLVIGIAGLGVVMVRAVRERRRQIGMLRAMGFPSRVVRAAFLVEATFIAAQGIVIGVLLGLVVSYTLLTRSSTFGESQLDYTVPWAALAVLVTVPLVASLLAVAVPASRAAAIQPAAALRIAD